ncbi:MAG: hypothetical protein HS100_13110 [Anaerolineales bacterium]|nr:hypothetical protein [Anaerolineales bacterium]
MKRQTIVIAILALILPMLVRGLWFYRGVPQRSEIATPDYASFERPQAPINTPDLEDIEQMGGTVLIDGFHGNQFTLNEIEALTSAIRARGGNVETVSDSLALESLLKTAAAFVSVSPSITFTQYETTLLENFAERGGRILVFIDATRNTLYFDYITGNPIAYGDANAANSLLKQFDIAVNNDYLYNTESNEGNFRNVLFDEFGKSELTFGLKEIAFYGSRSVGTDSGLLLLQGSKTNFSSLNDAHDPNAGGAALSADGNVAAFGDFTFLSAPYSTYTDNASLIQNLADFALSGVQSKSLDLFPYIFTQKTVQVFVSPDVEKDPSLITALGGLQSSLRFLNLKLQFVDDIPSSGDAILIGSFDATEDFDNYLLKADVEIGDESIDTVAFGEIGRFGNGLMLFASGDKGNTLVLLAGSPEDIVSLIGVASYNSVSSCLTSETVAVCSVGSGDSYLYGETTDEFSDESLTDSADQSIESELEVTPTPGG